MSSRKNLSKERTSSFGALHIPMTDADAAGYGGEVPQLTSTSELPIVPKSQAMQLREENSVLRDELEDLRQQLQSRTSSLAVQDGTLLVHDFQFTSKGLIAPDDIDQETWQQVGNLLFKLEGSLQWLIGDWLVYGEKLNYGETKKLAEMMGRDPQTFYDYANVSRSVQFSLRNENLSFNHHRAVAKLSPHKQLQALTYAAEKSLSVANFRKWLTPSETVEVKQVSEYDATPLSQHEDTFEQYFTDIKQFNPKNPRNFSKLSPNDANEIVRRAQWLSDYFADVVRAVEKSKTK